MRAPTTTLLATLALVAGCGDDRFAGGPLPAAAPVFRVLPGASVIANPTGGPGFGISANVGGSYRLVWTSGTAATLAFQGSIWTPGRFVIVAPGCGGVCSVEGDFVSEVRVVDGAERIDFDARANGDLDGIDFAVDAEPVYFDLLVEGARNPSFVSFTAADPTGATARPSTIPFGLTTLTVP